MSCCTLHAAGHRLQRFLTSLSFGACSLWLVACSFLVLTSGCVRRSLTIRTDPPGAMIYVNDELKGTSPVTYDFTWYGWYRVIARKDGYQRLDDRKLLRAPVHLWIPFDLVMELLPVSIRDQREWTYALTPAERVPVPVPPPVAAPNTPTDAPAAEELGDGSTR